MVDQTSSPVQWLDLLPDEVCEAIAAHVTYGESDSSGTSLAQTSKKQCRAVWNTVPHPVHVCFPRPDRRSRDESDDEEHVAEWALAFAGYESHLQFVELTPHVADVLQKSNVTKCSLRTENDMFMIFGEPGLPSKTTKIVDEVLAKVSIRYLSIELTKDANIKELFKQMSMMNLEELHLTGSLKTGDWLDELANSCADISTRCPSLREIATSDLFIGCPDGRGMNQYHNDTYWRAVEKLPACCKIAVHSDPPDRLIGKLRKLRGVEVCYLSPQKTSKLGPSVTSYTDRNLSHFKAKELDPLKKCVNLRELDLSLAPGAISHLPKILRHLTSLCSLAVSREDVTKVSDGTLLDVVRAAPQLRDLDVSDILFSPAQWKSALEILGRRLRKLKIWLELDSEDESFDEQVDRLEAILESVLKYNRCLNEFSYGRIDCPVDLKEHGEKRDDSILALASRVQDAIPCLENGSLEERCENIIFIPVAEE